MTVHFDPIEILEAYYTKHTIKKDSPRYKLAQDRLKICESCDKRAYSKVVKRFYCGECGCAIEGKIFSKYENQCPLQKWAQCDHEYFNKGIKHTNTLI